MWAEPCFGWVQVFTPGEFPGKGARAVAIEPMTCPPDALNSGIDLISVAAAATRGPGALGNPPAEHA